MLIDKIDGQNLGAPYNYWFRKIYVEKKKATKTQQQ